jgi:hypothetical protein
MAKRKSTPKKNEQAKLFPNDKKTKALEEDIDTLKPKKAKLKVRAKAKQGITHDIKRLQRSTNLLIPKAPFLRCVSHSATLGFRDGRPIQKVLRFSRSVRY